MMMMMMMMVMMMMMMMIVMMMMVMMMMMMVKMMMMMMMKLTVVNTDYLRHTYRSGGHENYLLSELPPTLTALLESQGLYLPADHTFPPNVTLLGCLHPPACDDALPAPAANISFGKWLRTSTSPHSSLVLSNRNGVSFTPSEVGGVYTALMNATVLGSGVFRSRTTSQTQCQTWARSLCQGLSLPASLVDFDSKVCGLVHILQLCQSESLLRTEVKNLFVSSFCPSPGVVCLDLSTVANQLVLSAYFQVFQDYVLNYLLQVLHDFLIARVNRDLVVTRTQRELALGYDVSTSVDQSASSHVQGLLDDYWLKSANSKGSLWKVNTCLKDRNMNNNMKVRDSFTWSSRYVVSCGLQELTSSLGFVGWVSVPQLTSGHLQREATDHHNCSLPKLQSFALSGIKLTTSGPSGLEVRRLNHLATASVLKYPVISAAMLRLREASKKMWI
ncbi:hypothetical protein ACOMHN_003891 [Nucella lapillus]